MNELKSSLKNNANRLKTIANELSKENADVPEENRKEINEFIGRYYKNKTEHFTNKIRKKFAVIKPANDRSVSFAKASEQMKIAVKELQECVNDANCVLNEMNGDNNKKRKLDTVDNDVKNELVKPSEPPAKKFRLADGTVFEPGTGCITWGTQSAPDAVSETKETRIRGKIDAALALTKLNGHVTDIGVIRCYISKGICETASQTELTADCPSCTKTRFIRQNARSIRIQTDASEIDGEIEALVQHEGELKVTESEVQADSHADSVEATVEEAVQPVSQPATPPAKTDYASTLTELGNLFPVSEEAPTSMVPASIERQPPSVEVIKVIEVVENGAKTASKADPPTIVVHNYTELQKRLTTLARETPQPVKMPQATPFVTQTPDKTAQTSVVPNGIRMPSSQNLIPAPVIYTPPQPRPPPPTYQQHMPTHSQYTSIMQQLPLLPSGHENVSQSDCQPTYQPSQQPMPNICIPCAGNISRLSRPNDKQRSAKTSKSRPKMPQQQIPMQNNMIHNFTQSIQPQPQNVQPLYNQMLQQPMFQHWLANNTNLPMSNNNIQQSWQ